MKNLKSLYLFLSIIIASLILASCNPSAKTDESEKHSDKENLDTIGQKGKKIIVFFGNSLTAGYGLDDPSQAFTALIQKRIDSLGLEYKVVNAGVSGETTAGGKSRIDWLLKQPLDIFVLELGGNDGLRGIPVSETRRNLQAILEKVHAKYPQADRVLAGMQIPPNMGQDYTSEFKRIYPDLATENDIPLIPFLLEGVGGEASLNLPDGIHPNADGHRIVAENVWKTLQPIL
ncbi:arylesterase [Dyadobacter tibetensis]|uniref:arylesterase n=1 Tax=Dyadobacter tibetensis TaxID=1211851 RepID=UPI0004BB1693|nr:arylesterase [Dyadobacter tibetensis]